jgi:indolepyruvate decarboxylase
MQEASSPTVIEHVLSRLETLGISKVFGVAGDFAFPIEDAIVECDGIDWVGCCNELNAAYAADGYARTNGIAALNTTYGVGELSAIGAIAGAYSERVPVFHLVGMPNLPTQAAHTLVHHTLGNGEFDAHPPAAHSRDSGIAPFRLLNNRSPLGGAPAQTRVE